MRGSDPLDGPIGLSQNSDSFKYRPVYIPRATLHANERESVKDSVYDVDDPGNIHWGLSFLTLKLIFIFWGYIIWKNKTFRYVN